MTDFRTDKSVELRSRSDGRLSTSHAASDVRARFLHFSRRECGVEHASGPSTWSRVTDLTPLTWERPIDQRYRYMDISGSVVLEACMDHFATAPNGAGAVTK